MKILFDTNVIIAGFISRGYTYDVIKEAIFRHEVYYTDYLLTEVNGSLSKKFPLSDEAVSYIIRTIKKHFIKGKTAKIAEDICRDSKDNQVLADAANNDINVIITGDKDLLVLKQYKEIKIIVPRDYWKL